MNTVAYKAHFGAHCYKAVIEQLSFHLRESTVNESNSILIGISDQCYDLGCESEA